MSERWQQVKKVPPRVGEQVLAAWGNCAVMVAYLSADGLWRAAAQRENPAGMATILELSSPPIFWRDIPDNPLTKTCEEIDALERQAPDPAPAPERRAASDVQLVCDQLEKYMSMISAPHINVRNEVAAAIARLRAAAKLTGDDWKIIATELASATLERAAAAPPDPFAEARATLERERPKDKGWGVVLTNEVFMVDTNPGPLISLVVSAPGGDNLFDDRFFGLADLPRAVAEAVRVMREHKEAKR